MGKCFVCGERLSAGDTSFCVSCRPGSYPSSGVGTPKSHSSPPLSRRSSCHGDADTTSRHSSESEREKIELEPVLSGKKAGSGSSWIKGKLRMKGRSKKRGVKSGSDSFGSESSSAGDAPLEIQDYEQKLKSRALEIKRQNSGYDENGIEQWMSIEEAEEQAERELSGEKSHYSD